jgi:hypothetical protein
VQPRESRRKPHCDDALARRAGTKLVERWRPDDARPEVLDHDIAWQPGPDAPPLRIDLDRFFVDVMDAT